MERSEIEKLLTLAEKEKTFLTDLSKETLKDAYKMLYETSEEFIGLEEL